MGRLGGTVGRWDGWAVGRCCPSGHRCVQLSKCRIFCAPNFVLYSIRIQRWQVLALTEFSFYPSPFLSEMGLFFQKTPDTILTDLIAFTIRAHLPAA